MNGLRIGWIITGILAVVMVLTIVFVPKGADNKPTTDDSSMTTATNDSAGTTAPVSDEADILPPKVLDTLKKDAVKAIKIYGSYPNESGPQPTLDQLEPLVSRGFLDRLQSYWGDGSELGIQAEVKDVIVLPESTVSSDSVTFWTRTAQEKQFPNSETDTFYVDIFVTLEKQSSTWIITDIEEMGVTIP